MFHKAWTLTNITRHQSAMCLGFTDEHYRACGFDPTKKPTGDDDKVVSKIGMTASSSRDVSAKEDKGTPTSAKKTHATSSAKADGEVIYSWTVGRQAGNPTVTVPYKSQKIDTDIYLVGWNEPASQTFVTMVYNFKSNTSSVSVLARYGAETPFFGFQGGVIEHVVGN